MKAWYEFLEQVREAREALPNPNQVWYRGHSNGDWQLVPSLHRFPNGLSKEQDLFADFQRSANRLFEKRDNDWEALFDMQHYGIPTRLLDWTGTLGVAIAFAVFDHHASHGDPALWVLDPLALNDFSGLDEIKDTENPKFDYKSIYWHSDPFAAQYPIALEPHSLNARMAAQDGKLTVHGRNPESIESMCPLAISRVPMRQSVLDGAREFLTYAHLNPYTIYPDILGMARHFRRKHLGA